MNIAFLAPHTRVSGGIKTIFELAHGLVLKGHKCTIVANKIKDPVMHWFSKPLNFTLVDARKIDKIGKFLSKFDCLVNFGDGPEIDTVQTKKILYFQGFVSGNNKNENKQLRKPYNAIVTTSPWLFNIASTTNPTAKVFTVPPGIDNHLQHIPGLNRNRVPTIGTLHHPAALKNFSLFVRTLVNLFINYNTPVHAIILSATGIYEIGELDIQRIPYSIFKDPPVKSLPYVYNSCDLWFSTSKNEGFGLTPLEAMACNVPVLWHPNGGLETHMLHDTNCVITATAEDAAKQIHRLLGDNGLRERLIRNGKALSEKFKWEHSVNLFNNILKEIVGK